MSRVTIIVGYFFCVCLFACIIAYPIYLASGVDFERIVSRSILVFAVLLFYPMYRYLKITNLSVLGFHPNNSFPAVTQAWLFGMLMLIPISAVFLICGFRVWEPLADDLMSPLVTIALAIISGLVIGLIEETLFRGFLQSQISHALNAVWSILIVSIIYSSVHFLQAPDMEAMQSIHWYSGFTLLFAAFGNLANISQFYDSWIALFLAGAFLSIVRLRTDNIIYCIGIHAGWVTHIKLFKSSTDRNNEATCATLASPYDNYIGELSTAWILIILFCWLMYRMYNRTIQQ